MPPPGFPFEADALIQAVHTTPGLELLLMFGSRARGEAQDESDWDFGYLATDGFDATALLCAIVERVGTDLAMAACLSLKLGTPTMRTTASGRAANARRAILSENGQKWPIMVDLPYADGHRNSAPAFTERDCCPT